MAVGRTSPFRILFCVAFIAAAIYSAVIIGRPQYRYHVVESELIQISIMTSQSVGKLETMVWDVLREREIPVKPDSVRVYKNDTDDVGIRVAWDEDVYIFGRYVTTNHFVVHVGGAVR